MIGLTPTGFYTTGLFIALEKDYGLGKFHGSVWGREKGSTFARCVAMLPKLRDSRYYGITHNRPMPGRPYSPCCVAFGVTLRSAFLEGFLQAGGQTGILSTQPTEELP